ncbi:hypothetical protein E2C01_051773 [Portunus trituberculatus]|uniref:Uncharacterized protein n=1 Tax=Portunus trituberculatus TaxID=210409 RepID=A0A5B7GK87_PORTR|nr:hypothetical protein [Portunus trituberculatus]
MKGPERKNSMQVETRSTGCQKGLKSETKEKSKVSQLCEADEEKQTAGSSGGGRRGRRKVEEEEEEEEEEL